MRQRAIAAPDGQRAGGDLPPPPAGRWGRCLGHAHVRRAGRDIEWTL